MCGRGSSKHATIDVRASLNWRPTGTPSPMFFGLLGSGAHLALPDQRNPCAFAADDFTGLPEPA